MQRVPVDRQAHTIIGAHRIARIPSLLGAGAGPCAGGGKGIGAYDTHRRFPPAILGIRESREFQQRRIPGPHIARIHPAQRGHHIQMAPRRHQRQERGRGLNDRPRRQMRDTQHHRVTVGPHDNQVMMQHRLAVAAIGIRQTVLRKRKVLVHRGVPVAGVTIALGLHRLQPGAGAVGGMARRHLRARDLHKRILRRQRGQPAAHLFMLQAHAHVLHITRDTGTGGIHRRAGLISLQFTFQPGDLPVVIGHLGGVFRLTAQIGGSFLHGCRIVHVRRIGVALGFGRAAGDFRPVGRDLAAHVGDIRIRHRGVQPGQYLPLVHGIALMHLHRADDGGFQRLQHHRVVKRRQAAIHADHAVQREERHGRQPRPGQCRDQPDDIARRIGWRQVNQRGGRGIERQQRGGQVGGNIRRGWRQDRQHAGFLRCLGRGGHKVMAAHAASPCIWETAGGPSPLPQSSG